MIYKDFVYPRTHDYSLLYIITSPQTGQRYHTMNYYTYQIINTINGKKYIGFSKNPNIRWKNHKSNSKYTKSCPRLYNAMNKYGVENFNFSILNIHTNIESALSDEIDLIEKLKTTNPKIGYNISGGGKSGGFVDCSHREKCIRRMITNNPMKILRTNRGSFKKGNIPIITKERNTKISLSKKGDKNPMYGNINASLHLNSHKIKCVHCGKPCNLGNLKRWHMDNCKSLRLSLL